MLFHMHLWSWFIYTHWTPLVLYRSLWQLYCWSTLIQMSWSLSTLLLPSTNWAPQLSMQVHTLSLLQIDSGLLILFICLEIIHLCKMHCLKSTGDFASPVYIKSCRTMFCWNHIVFGKVVVICSSLMRFERQLQQIINFLAEHIVL